MRNQTISMVGPALVSAAAFLSAVIVLGGNPAKTNGAAVAHGPAKTSRSYEAYPWSEESEYVRVAKPLLKHLGIQSMAITNFATMNFVVAPLFAATFSLNPDEVAGVNRALTNALHAYRTVQGVRFESLDDESVLAEGREEQPFPSGSFRFRLKPFAKEAIEIRERLEAEILEFLGKERADFFWRFPLLESELNSTNQGQFDQAVFTFRLLKEPPGPLVDIRVGTPGNFYARPYGAPLDPYAPEALKPILARWREWIAQNGPDTFGWSAPPEADLEVKAGILAGNQARSWNDLSPFVELPKGLVLSLPITGLTPLERISPEAVSLLSLTAAQVEAVEALYRKMKGRLEELELAHLERTDPVGFAFLLRKFPEKAAALKNEWIAGLNELVGAGRAGLLDASLRGRDMAFRLRQMAPEEEDFVHPSFRFLQGGARWFERGIFDVRIEIKTVLRENARPDQREIREFRYESDGPENGQMGGPRLVIPKRFEHLITPDRLRPLSEVF